MADVVDRRTRSWMMSGIRGKDTHPERQVRSALWKRGFRFRLNARDLPGRPDLVLPKWRAVVQVQGCFWHGHSRCRYFKTPGSRTGFWTTKIRTNRRRDARSLRAINKLGWRCITVWECALRDDLVRALDMVHVGIQKQRGNVEIRSTRGVAKIVKSRRKSIIHDE